VQLAGYQGSKANVSRVIVSLFASSTNHYRKEVEKKDRVSKSASFNVLFQYYLLRTIKRSGLKVVI
jgi:hypothetical protein